MKKKESKMPHKEHGKVMKEEKKKDMKKKK
jgi:hypothetical protein